MKLYYEAYFSRREIGLVHRGDCVVPLAIIKSLPPLSPPAVIRGGSFQVRVALAFLAPPTVYIFPLARL